jgi:UDP:flavonoid glycosyltransferase YjiC (YdhE family)
MTTTGYGGHFLPLVPFARAFARAGHEVRVAAPRSRRAAIERAGLDCVACADPSEEDLGRLVASLAELSRRDGHAHMMSVGFATIATRAVLQDMLEIVEGWRPHVVVRESQEYAGALAAERGRVPHVRVALGLSVQEDETLSIAAGAVDELRRALGLPADPDARALRESPYLTFVPPALEQPGAPGQPAMHRFRDIRNGAQGPRWIDGDDPFVYVTFGSVAGLLGLYPRVYRATLEQLAELPARILVTIGDDADPGELDPLPPNVHVERWIAQDAVIPHADAVVCHGGYGSVLGALAHGVPVVALPIFADDQWRNARRLDDLGAGIALEGNPGPERRMLDGPDPPAFRALPEAIEAVMRDAAYRRGARGVAQAIDALTPVDAAVDLLEAIAHGANARPHTPAEESDQRSERSDFDDQLGPPP